jgi:hypothetical protein
VSRHRHHWFRFAALVGVVGYVLSTTSFFHLAFDVFANRTKVVAVADIPCATHACGCLTAEQCAKDCCCFPGEPEPEPMPPGCPMHLAAPVDAPPVTTEVLAICVAACAGGSHDDGTVGAPRAQPHDVPLAFSSAPDFGELRWASFSSPPVPSHDAVVPEPVPISIS